jgi:hypothetical protein
VELTKILAVPQDRAQTWSGANKPVLTARKKDVGLHPPGADKIGHLHDQLVLLKEMLLLVEAIISRAASDQGSPQGIY